METTTSLPSRDIPLASLRLEHGAWVNPRKKSGLSDKEIEELAEDIKVRGIQVPILVQKVLLNGESIDVVLDGQRRYLAGKKAGLKVVPAVDKTEEPIELTAKEADGLLLDTVSIAQHRAGLSSPELVAVAKRLRDHDHTMFDIGQSIGKSETWVSKMLKAYDKANPVVTGKWEAGKITDEQFKELATLKVADQTEGLQKAMTARESGDAAGARHVVKEMKEKAAEKTKAKASKKDAKDAARVVRGPQLDLIDKDPPKKIVKPGPAVLDDIVHQAHKRPPTSDYVKGQVDMARYVLGQMSADDFKKPWHAWLARVAGHAKVKAPKRERHRGGKARKGKKAAKKSKR
jgi:ParB/RepB/Spo0J family partition protein